MNELDSRANRRIRDLLAGRGNDGEIADELLNEFWQGYDPKNLVPLLKSTNKRVVSWAAYILSELGERGQSIIETSVELLTHNSEDVRSSAIENLLSCADRAGFHSVAQVVTRYDVEGDRIRRELVNYIARVSLPLLKGGIASIADKSARERHSRGFEVLTSAGTATEQLISDALVDRDDVIRAYAIAAAIRLTLVAGQIGKVAKKTNDSVVSSEAKLWFDSAQKTG